MIAYAEVVRCDKIKVELLSQRYGLGGEGNKIKKCVNVISLDSTADVELLNKQVWL